jgi:NAD(P)H-hydrate epimerase
MSEPLPMARQAVREVDRLAIKRYGIPGVILMENAGRGAAQAILGLLDDPGRSRVAIVCGAGNNGGDGFVIARHLHNAYVEVEIYLAVDPARLAGDAKVNYEIVRRMNLPIRPLGTLEQLTEAAEVLSNSDVVVDALLGTGFSGEVRPPLDAIIRRINRLQGPKVVAVDLPSGLDCDTGHPSDATIRADLTVTFVAPKAGFTQPAAVPYVGRVVVVDIGVPRELVPGR